MALFLTEKSEITQVSQDSNLMRHLASDVKRNRIASDQTLKCAKQQVKAVEGLGTI